MKPLPKVAVWVRQHGMSEQSVYRWKSNYDGMEIFEVVGVREADNVMDNKLLAEAELEEAMLCDVI